jgi:KaiC/GvpD/RAD55 family RecA-like ATPase/tetratricopeptide (TPR) repeat protein
MKQAILAEPVLVGRERELQELTRHLDSAAQGKGTTVFISGEAGSGKTRLTREFLKSAKKRGVAVMAGWCLSDSAAPFFPFVEAFNDYFEDLNAEDQPTSLQQSITRSNLGTETQMFGGERGITAWLTGPVQPQKLGKPELSPQVWKDQVFAGVAKTLHSISLQVPVILFIEDIHWADSASLALLQYIARSVSNSERILVLATFRSEALTTDAEGRPHPLAEALRAMGREDLYTEIKLPNLNQVDISKIAENMIGGNLQPSLTEKLTAESQGNPLFVVESLRMLFERKSLIQENNEWRLTVDELGIPTKIRDIILRRLAVLKYAQRRVLDAASVIGEKFNIELLATVLGQDSLDVLETLNAIAQSTSIVCVDENFYRFDHAKSREVLYEELSLPLKRGYHARVAERIEGVSKDGRLPFSDLAYHYTMAGNKEKAVKYALSAGEDALARWSNEEAIKHFTYILANVSDNPENAEAKRKAWEGLGDAYYANSMFKEAMKTFENISHSETGVIKLRALRKAIESTWQYQGSNFMELVKEAEPYAAADRLESARVLFFSKGKAHAPWPKLALEDMEAALRVFEEEYSLSDTASALAPAGLYRARLGEPQKGLAASLRAIALFEELGDFRATAEGCFIIGLTFDNCFLDDEALSMYAKVTEIDEKTKMNNYTSLVYAIGHSSKVYERKGDWGEALSHSLKALELSKKTDSLVASGLVYSNLTGEYVRLGVLKHPAEYFVKLTKLPPELLFHPYVQGVLAKAVFFAGTNQWKESNQCFKETFERLKADHSPLRELRTKMYFVWALKRQGRIEEAKVQLEDVQKTVREAEEKFAHVSLEASLMIRREVTVGEEFEMRLDFVNVSKKPGSLVKTEGVIPSEGFKVTALPSWCSLQNGSLEMKNREIGSFQVETIKLTLQAVKAGTFTLNPKAVYIDEMGETKTVNLNPVAITVQPAQQIIHVIPGRVSSGFDELDDLLGGGIPENYALVLASPSDDERSLLIKRFLERGAEAGEVTFYITAEAGTGKALAEKYPSNFTLFLCNPRADNMIQSQPNVVKLKGIENLTEIDIALTKAFRTLNPAAIGPKRACIEIVSDVLLQHHAVITRKWLSALLPDLKAKGFTTLAVIDPQMHPPEESRAIISLFDGEIAITEKENVKGPEKILKVRKLVGQKYLEGELALTREKLSS